MSAPAPASHVVLNSHLSLHMCVMGSACESDARDSSTKLDATMAQAPLPAFLFVWRCGILNSRSVSCHLWRQRRQAEVSMWQCETPSAAGLHVSLVLLCRRLEHELLLLRKISHLSARQLGLKELEPLQLAHSRGTSQQAMGHPTRAELPKFAAQTACCAAVRGLRSPPARALRRVLRDP